MAVALGARGYLTKPFTEVQLLARVTGLLRRPNKSRMIDEADVVDI
jgi:DNA-binding response OmpR family regulator